MKIEDKILLTDEEIGDNHISTSDFTPIRDDAFDKSDDEKISIIQEHNFSIKFCCQVLNLLFS